MAVAVRTPVRAARRKPRGWTALRILVYALLVLGAFVVLLPFIWSVATSFKLETDIVRYPP